MDALSPTIEATGSGCHGGRETMLAAAGAAGKTAAMDQLMQDYPRGPHDQPQSMCPAFGSLRVGLRMRRVATILSGSACCVYGLTFTSHFYGAKRSVGYVPFNSETLVTGKLFEDIREAVQLTAKPEEYDAARPWPRPVQVPRGCWPGCGKRRSAAVRWEGVRTAGSAARGGAASFEAAPDLSRYLNSAAQ